MGKKANNGLEMDELRRLSGKQNAFVEHYTGDCSFNATEAASRAKYKGDRAALAVIGTENIRKPNIRTAILAKAKENEHLVDVEVQEIVIELRGVAFSPAQGVSGLDTGNRLRALELLGRYKAMFTDNYNQTGDAEPKALTDAERARLKLMSKNLLTDTAESA